MSTYDGDDHSGDQVSISEDFEESIASLEEAETRWANGYGVIRHTEATQARVREMVARLCTRGDVDSPARVYEILAHADRVANAAMWLVVHATYANRVYLDGRPLAREDFKKRPEGHTGGSLNMVPGYIGYFAANALTLTTRSWLMGQGHCVSAIDATNVLLDNLLPEQAARYDVSDEGLSRFVSDFYSYRITPEGRVEPPLGSHVNAYTAGGILEGGYLGFAEILYVHMPLPGDSLVAFLSDGAFEEQRGSDWTPRWWRSEDSGLVVPILIANGRRIDQRTVTSQQGGVSWLRGHLEHNSFEPIDIDGRDPAAFAWAIIECEERLQKRGEEAARGGAYPVRLPYVIAEAPKGYGFPGQGENRAHNLPLGDNPHTSATARRTFREGAAALWVRPEEILQGRRTLTRGVGEVRPPEREHPLANRRVAEPSLPEPPWAACGAGEMRSSMEAIDLYFTMIVQQNPKLRARVGNPDELRSNRLNQTLDLLKHRVTQPEPGVAESVCGGIITVLNEEAVVCAALGNKGGINLVATYEAFGVKMLGALRQEILFARHQKEVGRPAGWLSVPVLLTSHTWENGKNEHSHQDTTLAEALMGEMADMSRVIFPADWNSALVALRAVYQTRGTICTMVVAKDVVPSVLAPDLAARVIEHGLGIVHTDERPQVILTATGAYQLSETMRASRRLSEREVPHRVVYLAEPGRLRIGRDSHERDALTPEAERERIYPAQVSARVFVTHTRPEPLLGVIRPLDTGAHRTCALGYRNRGGTLSTFGMLYVNGCTWAHIAAAAADVLGRRRDHVLGPEELAAVSGHGAPDVLF